MRLYGSGCNVICCALGMVGPLLCQVADIVVLRLAFLFLALAHVYTFIILLDIVARHGTLKWGHTCPGVSDTGVPWTRVSRGWTRQIM